MGATLGATLPLASAATIRRQALWRRGQAASSQVKCAVHSGSSRSPPTWTGLACRTRRLNTTMSATQPPRVQRQSWILASPLLFLVLLASCAAGSDVSISSVSSSRPRPQAIGFGIGDYEYLYDELPREHLGGLGRLRRATAEAADASEKAVEAYREAAEALKEKQPPQEHVQHVPANAPRAPQAAGADSAIQRVPGPRVEAGAEVPAAAAPVPVPAAQQDQAPSPAALQPSARVQVPEEVHPAEQAPEGVPAAVPAAKLANESKEPKEDMETSNFFWGLGPVYPHLYVYRRVPHLVPLHGWSPYHAYYITHPSSR